jgi:hypothetical protein
MRFCKNAALPEKFKIALLWKKSSGAQKKTAILLFLALY